MYSHNLFDTFIFNSTKKSKKHLDKRTTITTQPATTVLFFYSPVFDMFFVCRKIHPGNLRFQLWLGVPSRSWGSALFSWWEAWPGGFEFVWYLGFLKHAPGRCSSGETSKTYQLSLHLFVFSNMPHMGKVYYLVLVYIALGIKKAGTKKTSLKLKQDNHLNQTSTTLCSMLILEGVYNSLSLIYYCQLENLSIFGLRFPLYNHLSLFRMYLLVVLGPDARASQTLAG